MLPFQMEVIWNCGSQQYRSGLARGLQYTYRKVDNDTNFQAHQSPSKLPSFYFSTNPCIRKCCK
jgi:hypothetical protein